MSTRAALVRSCGRAEPVSIARSARAIPGRPAAPYRPSRPGGHTTTNVDGKSIGGWKRGAVVAVPAFVFAAGLGLGKIVRDCSLTCNVGYRYAPLAILAVALAVVPLASVANRSERRWGYRRWQLSSLALAAASLIGFRLLTFWLVRGQDAALAAGRPDAAWLEALRWAYLAFYVWVGALATLLSANVLSSVQRVFPAEERERGVAGLPLAFALGGLAGSLLASEGAAWLMTRFHWRYEAVRDHLMIAMAACFLLQVPVVLAIERLFPPPRATEAPSGRASLSAALRRVFATRVTSGIAAVVLLGGAADTLLAYGFYWLVSLQVGYENGRTLYFATFYAWLNGVNLALLAFGTPRLIQRFGLGFALVSLPLAAAAGASVLAIHAVVTVMYALRIATTSLRSALYEPALNRLLVAIPAGEGGPTRLLRGLIPRFGEALGAVVALVFSLVPALDVRALALLLVALLLAWAAAAAALRSALPPRDGAGGVWRVDE